jgi:GntR family transcriptional repressor for pyruvate dehydrogenase complex
MYITASLPSPPQDRKSGGDLTARLIASFKQLIADGVLSPGSRLPPERQLAARFGVSRTSLRQALKVLEIMGILTQRVGDGTYFNTALPTALSEPIDFLCLLGSISREELFDLRLLVEPTLAARAAERATAADLQALHASLKTMRANRGHPLHFLEHDVAFHDLIFRIAGNRACGLLFTVIHRALLTTFLGMPLQSNTTMGFHRSIVEAIEQRKPRETYQRMEAHLLSSRSVLRENRERQKTVTPSELKPIPKLRRSRKSAH